MIFVDVPVMTQLEHHNAAHLVKGIKRFLESRQAAGGLGLQKLCSSLIFWLRGVVRAASRHQQPVLIGAMYLGEELKRLGNGGVLVVAHHKRSLSRCPIFQDRK